MNDQHSLISNYLKDWILLLVFNIIEILFKVLYETDTILNL